MILKGTPATISAQWFDADSPADPGSVTVMVSRADGIVLVASTAAAGSSTNPRTFVLTTTHTAQVDVLTAAWVSATHGTVTTYHPIVGGFYVDLNTLRNSGLADETKFPDAALADGRWWWHDLVDNYCTQSFVPSYRLQSHYRTVATDPLVLDRPHVRQILSATLDGAAVDTSTWTPLRSGEIITPYGVNPTVGPGMLQISYEHGHDYPDRVLYDAGIIAIADHVQVKRAGGASRQMIISNQYGTARHSYAGTGRGTGIPDVDAVLNRRIGDISF
jgi:hypothetical protein